MVFKKGQKAWNKRTKGVCKSWNKGKNYKELYGNKELEIKKKQRLAKLKNPSPTQFKKGHKVSEEVKTKRRDTILKRYGQ